MSAAIEKGLRRTQRISDDTPVKGNGKHATPGLLVEMYHPWALGVCAAFLGYRIGYLHLLGASWAPAAMDKVNTIMATFGGFLMAVIALMPGLEERSWMRRFREMGYQRIIIHYFRSALFATLFSLGLTTAQSFFSYQLRMNRTFDGVYSLIWWGVLGFVLAAIVRAMRLMLKLLIMK